MLKAKEEGFYNSTPQGGNYGLAEELKIKKSPEAKSLPKVLFIGYQDIGIIRSYAHV